MWFALALLAAVLWGCHYALSGRALQTLSPAALMVVLSACQLVIFSGVVLASGTARQLAPRALGPLAWQLAAIVALSAAANWCVGASIQGRNATLAGLVEMTYPLFTAAFAFLLFREIHVSPTSAAGGALVVVGLGLVVAGAR